MYNLPKKLKLFAIIFMVVGAIGMISGFLSAPSTTAEVKEMLASHDDGHGGDTNNVKDEGIPDEGHDEASEIQGGEEGDNAHGDEEEHLEHVLQQLQNRRNRSDAMNIIFTRIVLARILLCNK